MQDILNSVHYAHASRGTISTVSRAVSLVGFNAVRNMALSLVLLDHMQDKAHASQMREEFLRAMIAGSVAAELCSTCLLSTSPSPRDATLSRMPSSA